MQAISTQISHHSTRKRKNAPLDDIPAITQDNPMAPQPKTKAKRKKVSTRAMTLTLTPLLTFSWKDSWQ
jgi:hypothetical protein